jgi:hypothetical protein
MTAGRNAGTKRVAFRPPVTARTRVCDAASLHIERSTDSDGDETVRLVGMSNGKRVVLLRELNDDRDIVRLERFMRKIAGV